MKSAITRSRTRSFDSEPSNNDDLEKVSVASKRSRSPRGSRNRAHEQQGSSSSSSHQRPLLPLQSGQPSSPTSSSSELRVPDQHGPEPSETESASVLTNNEADDDRETVDYASAEDEEHNHWIAFTDNCRFAPTIYPWWQTDTVFYGINCIIENNPSSHQPSPRPQVY